MDRQPDQKMRFDDLELSLMKNSFAENENALFVIRKVLLQVPLSEGEEKVLESVMSESVFDLIRKTCLPELDGDSPFFQMVDLKLALNYDIKDRSFLESIPYIRAKELEIDYIKQQIAALKDREAPQPISLKEMGETKEDDMEAYVSIIARNYLLSFVDSNVNQIKFLAGKKTESVEETKKRLQQDSSK